MVAKIYFGPLAKNVHKILPLQSSSSLLSPTFRVPPSVIVSNWTPSGDGLVIKVLWDARLRGFEIQVRASLDRGLYLVLGRALRAFFGLYNGISRLRTSSTSNRADTYLPPWDLPFARTLIPVNAPEMFL